MLELKPIEKAGKNHQKKFYEKSKGKSDFFNFITGSDC
jgi:hypothetical protein